MQQKTTPLSETLPPARDIFSYSKFWAKRYGTAPFLPMSRKEMDQLGWDSCDVILVTGDAYVDHPSFGMAIIGRTLEAQGFRVGIISQPAWDSADAFTALGRPNLYFGVTAGNMDSMINRYTADRRIRHNDSYTPNDEGGKRPDRSTLVYTQRCREAYKDVNVVIGGIEASLRRVAHYDYWSDKVRRSILFDSKADILLYGNAERAIVELTHRLATREPIKEITDIRGTAVIRSALPEGWSEDDNSSIDFDPDAPTALEVRKARPKTDPATTAVRLPAFEDVKGDPPLYAQASRIIHLESNAGNARTLIQRHGNRELWVNPPPIPLTTPEMDGVFGLPYVRAPHPSYGDAKIPAWDMIKFSINIMRGCFGGCTFCSITEHEGRVIQSRSEESILNEIEDIRDKVEGFTGAISDLGGPTSNMYRLACKDDNIQKVCRRLSCVYPDICKNLDTNHDSLIKLYRKARDIPGVKKISIASGLRYDLAVKSPEYIKELVTHHVGGYLKIAPEHTEDGPLKKMMKPGIGSYDKFKQLFEKYSAQAGKEQFLIPYFIAAHPGTTDRDMLNLSLWLKRNSYKADQVQAFYPSPMSLATAMYHSERNPLRPVRRSLAGENSETVLTPKGLRQRRLHKAFLRYHDPENAPILREALVNLDREDLIGMGPDHLVRPAGRGQKNYSNAKSFQTTHERPGKIGERKTKESLSGRISTPQKKSGAKFKGKRR